MVDLCVDKLLVLDIDQWSEEEDTSTEEGQPPKRNDLDEIVGDEGRSECSNRGDWVLSEQDALEFNDEEVDQLFEIVEGGFKGLLGDLVVPARSETASNSSAHNEFAGNLSESGDTESKVGDFEHPAQDWKISASEDEENSGSHGDRCGTGVLPTEQGIEERMIVCEVLTVGGSVGWRSS